MPRHFSELVNSEAGRAAIVLAGGPSCPAQFESIPAEFRRRAILIGVNAHGARLADCAYHVVLDDYRKFAPDLAERPGLIISPTRGAGDYQIVERPQLSFSGIAATWVAYMLGAVPVVLCGMDLYATDATYFHAPDARSNGRNMEIAGHLRRWRALRESVPRWMVRPCGGPLVDEGVFLPFDAAQTVSASDDEEAEPMKPETHGVDVVILRNCAISGRHHAAGEVVELRAGVARELVTMGRARYHLDDVDAVKKPAPAAPPAPPAPAAETPAPELEAAEAEAAPEAEAPESDEDAEFLASEKVKELAYEHGVDLATVRGTGNNGRILLPDVRAVIDAG